MAQLLHATRLATPTAALDPVGDRRMQRGKKAGMLTILPLEELDGIGDLEFFEEWAEGSFGHHLRIIAVEGMEVGDDPSRREAHGVAPRVEEIRTEAAANHGKGSGKGVARLILVRIGPEQIGEPITAVLDTRFNGEVDQQREVLSRPEAQRIAIRGIELRWPEQGQSKWRHGGERSAKSQSQDCAAGSTDRQIGGGQHPLPQLSAALPFGIPHTVWCPLRPLQAITSCLGLALLVVHPLSAQTLSPDAERLVVRVEAGDAAARKELMPLVRRMMIDWVEKPRTLLGAQALARATLAMAMPITPLTERPREGEIDWRGPAVKALRTALSFDSTDVGSLGTLERIAPYPFVWAEPEAELEHFRAAARKGALPVTLAMSHFGLELEFGNLAEARRILDGIPRDALPLAHRLRREAELAFAEGETSAGLQRYREGAAAIRSRDDAEPYFADVRWIATDAELDTLEALRPDGGEAAEWLERFWERRDLADARAPGSRLSEQFARWRSGLQEFRWDRDGSTAVGTQPGTDAAQETGYDGVPFPMETGAARVSYYNRYTPVNRVLDDRGRLVMRHGMPTRRLSGGLGSEMLIWVRPEGPLVVNFAHPAKEGAVQFRFGMLARNMPMGDIMTLCRYDASLCVVASKIDDPRAVGARRNNARYVAQLTLEKYTAARIDAETSDGNPERFTKALDGIIQAYGIPGGGVLVVAALPIDQLPASETASGARRATTAWRVVVGDPSGRIVVARDTIRSWNIPAGTPKGGLVTAYWTVLVPPGDYSVAVVIGDTLHARGASSRIEGVPVISTNGKAFRLSDPILGKTGSGLSFMHEGRAIALNPVNVWGRDDEAPLQFELDGLVVSREYGVEVEIWQRDGKPKSPRTTIRWTTTATAIHQREMKVLSFRELGKDDYRLVVRVRDKVSGGVVERSRFVSVR